MALQQFVPAQGTSQPVTLSEMQTVAPLIYRSISDPGIVSKQISGIPYGSIYRDFVIDALAMAPYQEGIDNMSAIQAIMQSVSRVEDMDLVSHSTNMLYLLNNMPSTFTDPDTMQAIKMPDVIMRRTELDKMQIPNIPSNLYNFATSDMYTLAANIAHSIQRFGVESALTSFVMANSDIAQRLFVREYGRDIEGNAAIRRDIRTPVSIAVGAFNMVIRTAKDIMSIYSADQLQDKIDVSSKAPVKKMSTSKTQKRTQVPTGTVQSQDQYIKSATLSAAEKFAEWKKNYASSDPKLMPSIFNTKYEQSFVIPGNMSDTTSDTLGIAGITSTIVNGKPISTYTGPVNIQPEAETDDSISKADPGYDTIVKYFKGRVAGETLNVLNTRNNGLYIIVVNDDDVQGRTYRIKEIVKAPIVSSSKKSRSPTGTGERHAPFVVEGLTDKSTAGDFIRMTKGKGDKKTLSEVGNQVKKYFKDRERIWISSKQGASRDPKDVKAFAYYVEKETAPDGSINYRITKKRGALDDTDLAKVGEASGVAVGEKQKELEKALMEEKQLKESIFATEEQQKEAEATLKRAREEYMLTLKDAAEFLVIMITSAEEKERMAKEQTLNTAITDEDRAEWELVAEEMGFKITDLKTERERLIGERTKFASDKSRRMLKLNYTKSSNEKAKANAIIDQEFKKAQKIARDKMSEFKKQQRTDSIISGRMQKISQDLDDMRRAVREGAPPDTIPAMQEQLRNMINAMSDEIREEMAGGPDVYVKKVNNTIRTMADLLKMVDNASTLGGRDATEKKLTDDYIKYRSNIIMKKSNDKVIKDIRDKYLQLAKMEMMDNLSAKDFSYRSSYFRATTTYTPSKIYMDGNSYKSAYSI